MAVTSARRPAIQSRGVALLIVLAALVAVVSIASTAARLAAIDSLRREVDRQATLADGLLPAVEAPIQEWLEKKSGSVVLPPDAQQPAIEVLNDQMRVDGRTVRIVITAWDQCGMIPLQAARSSFSLRSAVASEALAAIEALEIPADASVGLDLLEVVADSELPVFPQFTDAQHTEIIGLGGMLATHQPGSSSEKTGVTINVNTAPESLVEAVLRSAGRSGIDVIMAARRDGKPASAPGSVASNEHSIRLVTSSSAWAFRIDLACGPLKRSWWSVYLPQENKSKRQNPFRGWKCVQRLVIPE